MAIDSSLFAAVVPSGTYAVGDRVPMACIRGPAIVRDGYGPAKLKRVIVCGNQSGATFKITVKNSNWVDELSNPCISATETTFGNESGAVQSGNDAELVPNSGWAVVAECIAAGTESADSDVACLLDIDYPSVAAVFNPRSVKGVPVTIDGSYAHTIAAKGTITSAQWATYNVDFLKAGYKYLLTEASFKDAAASSFGFVSISGAAGQAGLERIIPVRSGNINGLRYVLDYSTPLVKGPFNINLMSVGTTAVSTNAYTYFDFVKKSM